MRYLRAPAAVRFPRFVDKSDGCWTWNATTTNDGYGRFFDGVRLVLAHRWSWTQVHGPIPDGLCVLHSCDNPRCVRVDHLWLGTDADNSADSKAKGRTNRARGLKQGWYTKPESRLYGEACGSSKLSTPIVLAIRERHAAGETQTALGKEFRVAQTTISMIVLRKRWTHI